MTPSLELLFILALLGHFVGDYLLQPRWMALAKSVEGMEGMLSCLIHCTIYSVVIYDSLMPATGLFETPWVFPLVFLSHYPVDRWELGQKWLDLIGGRNFIQDWPVVREFAIKSNPPTPDSVDHAAVVYTAFACIVYVVVDNTLHILLLFAGIAGLRHFGMI